MCGSKNSMLRTINAGMGRGRRWAVNFASWVKLVLVKIDGNEIAMRVMMSGVCYGENGWCRAVGRNSVCFRTMTSSVLVTSTIHNASTCF